MTTSAGPSLEDSLLPGPVLVVEDEPLTQARLRDVLVSLGYTGDALLFGGNITQAHTLIAEQPFALALIDVGLPDGNGIDLIRTLHERDPALPILVISTWSTEQVIVAALQAGATGYVLKERDELEISLSIRSALRGGAPIDPFVAKRILELIGKGGSLLAKPVAQAQTQTQTDRGGDVSPLTPREIEILSLVSKGLTTREIADVLALSKLTVGCHIRNIYKKLAVKSRTQAVFEARSYGLLS
ncbi:MAG: response regulator transcription factor [Ralstonia sp.]|nr:MAG: response regulator transcription factor [Ralstonia sp.]